MYQIYADDTLIYDSTVEDYKIGKGDGALETNKAGSFTFSLYPEHFFYNSFVKKKTVITVTKSDKILFRGRVLDDKVNRWNLKEIVCEGELNFLQDSVIRPYDFTGTPEELFVKFVNDHNSQVDEFKRFRIGTVTVLDPNNYIARKNSAYENTLSNLNSRMIGDSLGGYFHITHGDDGKDPIPTLHYLADFTEISSQTIEFGVNLKDYLKKGDGKEIATAIIPLGAEIDDGNSETENPRLTIADVNGGVDYVHDEAAVAAYGWIYQTVIWDDVTVPANLKAKAEAYLADITGESITVELTAIDLHMLDRSIESYGVDTYVRAVSEPHNFADTLLCTKQTFNILKPDSDTVTLGRSYSNFTGTVAKVSAVASTVTEVKKDVTNLNLKTNRYKIAEQQLTSLMAQSFGVFKTEEVLEDGSTVYYMHDKPTLAESTNIWKMTGDALAVSNDGGQTWNAGIDAEGNAIMNILSVIGIEASWIDTDNLAAISANIGGWEIKDDAIFKEFTESSAGWIYRVWIRPPDNVMGEGDFNTNPFIEIQVSTDGGSTFNQITCMSSLQMMFRTGGGTSYLYGSLGTTGLTTGNRGTNKKTLVIPEGVEVYDNSVRKAYFRDIDGTVCAYAPQVRSGDGLTMYFDFNFTSGAFRQVFKGGVLVDAYYI